ncbi:MAG: hypothetical protein ABL962_05490 [Fimbriimonadaceae bacterium]
MLGLALLLAVAPRTAPIGLENGVDGVKLGLSPNSAWGTQVGRIQVVPWMASTRKDPEKIALTLKGWERESDYNFWFKRSIRGIEQKLIMTQVQSEDGSHNFTQITVNETPPADGTIPADWPTHYRRGIYRILPDQLNLLKGKSPSRVQVQQNPVGESGEADYLLKMSLADADAAIQRQYPKWKRVVARDQCTYSVKTEGLPKVSRDRALRNVSVRQKPDGVHVVLRWTPGLSDRTDFKGRRLGTFADVKPTMKVPAPLVSNYGKALMVASGTIRLWEYTLPTSVVALKKKLLASGAKVEDSLEYLTVHIDNGSKILSANVHDGRIAEAKRIPSGWKATEDAAGFVDYVVVDKGKVARVTITERSK